MSAVKLGDTVRAPGRVASLPGPGLAGVTFVHSSGDSFLWLPTDCLEVVEPEPQPVDPRTLRLGDRFRVVTDYKNGERDVSEGTVHEVHDEGLWTSERYFIFDFDMRIGATRTFYLLNRPVPVESWEPNTIVVNADDENDKRVWQYRTTAHRDIFNWWDVRDMVWCKRDELPARLEQLVRASKQVTT